MITANGVGEGGSRSGFSRDGFLGIAKRLIAAKAAPACGFDYNDRLA
jgi:hypothetical protein